MKLKVHPQASREAAEDCSPRRKPWVTNESMNKPRRGERINGNAAVWDGAPVYQLKTAIA